MRPTHVIWLLGLLLSGAACADQSACSLPTTSPSADKGAMEKAYRDYFGTLLALAEKNDLPGLEKCCASAAQPVVTRSVCSLLTYIGGKNGDPKRFLSDTPQESDEVKWLWKWDALLLRQPGQKITARFPSGIAAFYIDQLYLLIDTEPAMALDRLLKIDRYADGEYGQYIADKLLALFKGRPQLVVAHWPQIRPYKSSVTRMAELYPDEIPQLRKQLGAICTPVTAKESCTEILDILNP